MVDIWMLELTVDCRVSGGLTVGWLLQDVAGTECGVQLERAVQLDSAASVDAEVRRSSPCPLIVCSPDDSPHCSGSASPARKRHLLSAAILLSPWVTAGPAPLEGDIRAAKGGTQVESEICVSLRRHRVWVRFTEAAIGSEQEAGVGVTTE